MGGTDKGLLSLLGKPMIEHVIDRLRPQVDELLVNANQNLETYSSLGCRVVPDTMPGFAGPLAGLQAGLMAARHELVATVPCDSPFLPADLIARLKTELLAQNSQLAVAVTHNQPQPVFCLCHRDILPLLTRFLQQDGRKISDWHSMLNIAAVNFDDQADAFMNINTPQDLNAAR